jgi:Cupin-like domain
VSEVNWRLAPWASSSGRCVVEDSPPIERFREHVLRRPRPVVLRGVGASWRSTKTWTFDLLRERSGAREVPLVRVRDGLLWYQADRGMAYESRGFGAFLDDLMSDPELAAEIESPPHCEGAPWRDDRLSIGTAGTTTPLHVELNHNIFVVLRGEKELILYPPSDTLDLYPQSPLSGVPHLSRIDPRRFDPERFPRVKRCEPWRCLLRDGDGVFIPRGWWHAVRTNVPTIATGNWWAEGGWQVLARASRLYSSVRKIRS